MFALRWEELQNLDFIYDGVGEKGAFAHAKPKGVVKQGELGVASC